MLKIALRCTVIVKKLRTAKSSCDEMGILHSMETSAIGGGRSHLSCASVTTDITIKKKYNQLLLQRGAKELEPHEIPPQLAATCA